MFHGRRYGKQRIYTDKPKSQPYLYTLSSKRAHPIPHILKKKPKEQVKKTLTLGNIHRYLN